MVAGVRFSVVAISAVLLATACSHADVVAPTTTKPPSFAVYVPPPGEGGVVCTGYLKGRAFGGQAGYIDYGHLCETSLDIVSPPLQAVYEDGHTGPYDLTVEFSRPVAHLVVMPVDLWLCGADPGSLTAYSPSGQHVTLPFTVDGSDCGNLHGNPESVHWYQSSTLPQSLVVEGLDSVTRVILHPTGTMAWDDVVYYPIIDEFGHFLGFRADHSESFVGTVYLLSFREQVTTADVTLFRAQGPNEGGSFTTRAGENKLSLAAGVTPATLAPTIQWEVVDDPADAVVTFEPNGVTPPFGGTVEALVPAQDAGRWAAVPHPGSLNQKSLALRVTAAVDASGTLVRSAPAIVRQDEIDTIREEYIELHVAQGVPGRGQFGASATNQGDYTVAVINPGFNSLFAALQIALQPWSLVVNSGYRNPVHNAYHVDKGRGSGAVSDSWHQYGCGDDIQTFPILPVFPTAAQLAAAQSYWDAVADEALSLGFTVEPRDRDPQHPDVSFSGVGHVHIELKCPLAQ